MEFEIRKQRGPSRGETLHRERRAYFDLVNNGVSSQEACRIVGINYRTGKRWRNGHKPSGGHPGSPPVVESALHTEAGRYLGTAERIHIADRLREGRSLRSIATELNRSASTISREVHRNSDPSDGQYRPYAAQQLAGARRPRPKTAKLIKYPTLRKRIQRHLDKGWSPEQIVQRLRRDFPHLTDMHLAPETIYQAVYQPARGGLIRGKKPLLRTGRTMRRPRRQAQARKPRFAAPMVMLDQRPDEVDDRRVPGHWEGDLVIGKDGRSQMGTLVERTSRYVMLLHLPDSRSPEIVRDALIALMQGLPQQLARSVTWDQGTELARHHEFTAATGIPVYFCEPHSPWQRGTYENTNGLLRQYFPKSTDLSGHTRADLDEVAAELNDRPRKILEWDTPAERLATLIDPGHGLFRRLTEQISRAIC